MGSASLAFEGMNGLFDDFVRPPRQKRLPFEESYESVPNGGWDQEPESAKTGKSETRAKSTVGEPAPLTHLLDRSGL
jgi:hypothetical protein